MADFSAVKVTADAAASKVTLTGQAIGTESVPVSITSTVTAEDGSTEVFKSTGTRQRSKALVTKLSSVTDDQGGKYTIAADGQSAVAS